ncbi:hypothetical protein PNOK_0335200 [Pyrrhoderma noxium]|uniref:BZIP domain-containing protein n=1 Tax=Pyrrhoderma noxium TaxID=2282107 RepID=A0A286UMP8_9AGAM|nr:hypothetical protein PNOK_0335200 [Pyrrhoderma noxium]
MPDDIDLDSRSLSQELHEDSDEHDGKDSSAAPGKPGRKKNPNSAAARRDQNRIAQREFRLRKQQRIRDLEARVEILSGSKDETFTELRNVVRDLMQENQTLRNLIRSLGTYIGDGMGGILPSLGFDRPQEFMDFINRAETDTAFEGFQRRKKAAQAARAAAAASGAGLNINVSKKHSLDEDDISRKRSKTLDEHLGINGSGSSKDTLDNSRFPPLLVPISPASNSNGNFYTAGNASSAMYMAGPTSTSYTSTPPSMNSGSEFPSSFAQSMGVSPAMGSPAFLSSIASASAAPPPTPPSSNTGGVDKDDITDDPKLQEATKLIHYHLDNYKRNNAYCLPQSLRPTLVQRTVPHESVIDGIPHPELRDKMILLRGTFDLVDALHDYVRSLTLHGDDVLAHTNWEIGESWLRRYGFLVDQSVLNICNRWRRERA